MKQIVFMFALTGLVTVGFGDDDPVFSGPQKGEKLVPFRFRNAVSDPVKDVDVISQADGKPVLLIFFHKRSRPAFGLMNALMKYAQTRKKDGLNSGVVALTDDPTETELWLKRIRNYFPEGATYGVSTDGPEGPGAYGLNNEVELTILIGREGRVTANFAIVQPSLQADAPKIARALAEVMGDKEPVDLQKFAGIARRGNDTRRQMARLKDAKLEPLIRAVINKRASDEQVDKAAEAVAEYLKGNAASRNRVGQIATNIVRSGNLKNYGTKRAQKYIREWAQKYGPQKPEKPRRTDRPSQRDSKPDAKKRDKPDADKDAGNKDSDS